jgi:hypothetical protein
MATRKHTGIQRTRVSTRSKTIRRAEDLDAKHRGANGRNAPRPAAATSCTRDLARIATNLAGAYSSAVALRLALEKQNAEHDGDIARCIRVHVTSVIADQIDRLIHAARRLGIPLQKPD